MKKITLQILTKSGHWLDNRIFTVNASKVKSYYTVLANCYDEVIKNYNGFKTEFTKIRIVDNKHTLAILDNEQIQERQKIKFLLETGHEVDCLYDSEMNYDEQFPNGCISCCTTDDFDDIEEFERFLNGEHGLFYPMYQHKNNVALYHKNQYYFDVIVEILSGGLAGQDEVIQQMRDEKKTPQEMAAYLKSENLEFEI